MALEWAQCWVEQLQEQRAKLRIALQRAIGRELYGRQPEWQADRSALQLPHAALMRFEVRCGGWGRLPPRSLCPVLRQGLHRARLPRVSLTILGCLPTCPLLPARRMASPLATSWRAATP
jgi:hypothetical protein